MTADTIYVLLGIAGAVISPFFVFFKAMGRLDAIGEDVKELKTDVKEMSSSFCNVSERVARTEEKLHGHASKLQIVLDRTEDRRARGH